jgi:hypothetical protein
MRTKFEAQDSHLTSSPHQPREVLARSLNRLLFLINHDFPPQMMILRRLSHLTADLLDLIAFEGTQEGEDLDQENRAHAQ